MKTFKFTFFILAILFVSACKNGDDQPDEIPATMESSWTKQTTPSTGELEALFFVDETTGWAGGMGEILHTTNGGQTWTMQAQLPYQVTAFSFINSTTGWASTGHGRIFKTTDGGENWVQNGDTFESCFIDISFVNVNTGWAVGCNGIILKTTDGGETWENQSVPSASFLEEYYASHFFSADKGVIMGYRGSLRTTVDGGASWSSGSPGTEGTFQDIFFMDENTGWAGGFEVGPDLGKVVKTTDGGATWTNIATIPNIDINAIYFVDNNKGWIVGERPSGGGGPAVYYTGNGGQDWSQQLFDDSQVPTVKEIQFVGAQKGWIVGYNGTILHTSTGSL